MVKRLPFILSAALCCVAVAHAAEPKPRIAYYPVKGKTAQEIYDSIRTTSPRVAPNATFAFTTIATKTDQRTAQAADGCRYSRFKTSGFFIFTVPAHSQPATLAPAMAQKLARFQSYLITHEEGHRRLWQACLKDYDAQAMALSAKSCEKLDGAREKLFTRIKKGCIQQDEAYDVVFRKEVQKEPFVAEALKGKRGKDR